MKRKRSAKHLVTLPLMSLFMISAQLVHASINPMDLSKDQEEAICIGTDCQADENPLENYQADSEKTDSEPVAEYIQAEIINPLGDDVTVRNLETDEVIKVSKSNSSIDLTDAEGVLVDSFDKAKYVILPNTYFPSMALKFAGKVGKKSMSRLKSWSECLGSVQGRYAASKTCSKSSRVMHPSLYDTLMKLPSLLGVSKVFLVHKGISGDRRHKAKKSLHNSFKAVDVSEIRAGSRSYNYRKAATNAGSSEGRFYLSLMGKWESAVKRRCGSTVRATTINWRNKNHRHHIHLGTTYNCR